MGAGGGGVTLRPAHFPTLPGLISLVSVGCGRIFIFCTNGIYGLVRVVQHPLHMCVVGNEPGQISRRPCAALPPLRGGYLQATLTFLMDCQI